MIRSKIKKFNIFLNQNDGDLKKRSLRSAYWFSFSQIISKSLQIVRSIILARLLTPDVFGVMGIIYVVINGIDVFTNTGFRPALIYRQDNKKEFSDTAWNLTILRGIILSLIIFFIAPFVASYYKVPILDLLLKVISISFFILGFENINTVYLIQKLDFKKISIVEVIHGYFSFFSVVILAFIYRNVWALVITYVLSSLLKVLLSYKIQPIKPSFRFQTSAAKILFKYSKFITGSTILVYLATQFDNAIVGKIMGMTSLGYYVLAYTLASIPVTHLAHVLDRVTFPVYSKLKDDIDALCRTYLKFLFFVSSLAIPAAFGLSYLSNHITILIYGEKWLPMVDSLIILCFCGLFRSIQTTTTSLFKSIGAPNIDFYSEILRGVLMLLTIFPLTKLYGIVGTSASVTFSIFSSMIFSLIMVNKKINLRFNSYTTIFTFVTLSSTLMLLGLILCEKFFIITNVFLLMLFIFLGIMFYILSFLLLSYIFPTIKPYISFIKSIVNFQE